MYDASKDELYLIDWGWCMHQSFDMNEEERKVYNQLLQDGFDWHHFERSLPFYFDQLEDD